jgi:multiple sugar transport system permease protein
MIMMMSGILGINPSLFEAAAIDGATSGQVLRKVTLPLLRPMVVYTLITSMIGGLQMFDIPYLFHTKKETINTYLETVAVFVYKNFRTSEDKIQYGYAGAASIILFIITAILGIIVFRMNRDEDEARKKKERKALIKEYKKQQKLAKMGGIN